MRFCVRRQIEFSNSNARLKKLEGVPIELAFPSDVDEFQHGRDRLAEVEKQVRSYRVPVFSVHAADGNLADDAFLDWAGRTVQFAEAVNAGIVVLHPEIAAAGRKKEEHQPVLDNIQHLQDRTKVTIAVETFWDKKRVLPPDLIMSHQLPMVLDTSRLPKSEITWVIETYHTHIVNLHLSAVIRDRELKGIARKHQPIDRDGFCMDILDRLQELNWGGVVTLEYMPWLHDKVLDDRKLLERIYSPGKL
ncbi:MAG: sugar phosphate isomerase/epimerase [Nitrospirota bacterium]|nr:sugar phosphate isomerase/epimerase [Nitrospirota bacterium]